MNNYLIKNAKIVNEGILFIGSVEIRDGIIKKIFKKDDTISINDITIIDAKGKYLIPGVIDCHVHFREPGLVNKADMNSESIAAIAGGVTSIMDMPNTNPQTTSYKALIEKYLLAKDKLLTNYSFYIGATNNNIDEILNINNTEFCGIKVFMGSSTGNMLVDDENKLNILFSKSKQLIAIHSEDENIIKQNIEKYKIQFNNTIPLKYHSIIRSEEACYKSTSLAIELAKKNNTKLHILHISTARELELLENIDRNKKNITSEVCINHLYFDDSDYEKEGGFLKINPSVKTKKDKEALLNAINSNVIDIISTDHAPHLAEEKQGDYFSISSGAPSIQFSLVLMLQLYKNSITTIENIVNKMCHAPADIYKIKNRGYIKEGYWADLVLVDDNCEWVLKNENILSKCKWSSFEGKTFNSKITHTFVNGVLMYDNGIINTENKGQKLEFDN